MIVNHGCKGKILDYFVNVFESVIGTRLLREFHHITFTVLVAESSGTLIFSCGEWVVQRNNLPSELNSEIKIIPPEVLFVSLTDILLPSMLQLISCVGLAVGHIVAVGLVAGVIVGFVVAVGLEIGCAVGRGVGFGVEVGISVGLSVGVAVGVAVGLVVGVIVGVAVGVAVGLVVGVIV